MGFIRFGCTQIHNDDEYGLIFYSIMNKTTDNVSPITFSIFFNFNSSASRAKCETRSIGATTR
jgi:hypothetical protein